MIVALALALLFFVLPVHGAWESNGTDQHVAVTDNAALTFPDADWTLALRFYVVNNAGTSNNFLIATSSDTTANPDFSVRCNEASLGSNPGQMVVGINDGDTTDVPLLSTNTVCNTTGSWQTMVLRRSNSDYTLYVNDTQEVTLNNINLNSLNPPAWEFFRRTDNQRHFPGRLCDIGFWTRNLSTAERTAYHKGFSVQHFPQSLAWHIPAIRAYTETKVPLTVTNTNTTVTACPRLYSPY